MSHCCAAAVTLSWASDVKQQEGFTFVAVFIVDVAAVTLSWASDVTPEEGFTFAAIHPGVVATDMNTASMRWALLHMPLMSHALLC